MALETFINNFYQSLSSGTHQVQISTKMISEMTQITKIPISNFCKLDVTNFDENLP